MARKLEQITTPIRQHLGQRPRFKLPSGEGPLPAPLEVARRRGEALLRLEFFGLMDDLGLTDPARQLALWDQLIERGGYILDFAQRTALLGDLPGQQQPARRAYTAYCILLHSLYDERDRRLFHSASRQFLRHHFLGLYPKQPNTRAEDPEQLRQRALVRLRKHWGLGMELKESFQTEDTGVHFSLRTKLSGHAWQTLLTETGERLKPTRIAAYLRLLEELAHGQHRPDTTETRSLPPKKSDPPAPFG